MKPKRIQRINSVISGRATDLPARFVRTSLSTMEPIYRTIALIRNRTFDRNQEQATKVGVPVVSIGNLTTGGTGKTPMVRWVIQQLLAMQQQPVIVSRGYGSKPGQPNDEFLELQLALPDTPHIQNPDRIAAAKKAIDQHRASTIVLDDGFQHRRIARNLDLVLIDATCPFGYDHLLPRGLLREPVDSLKRANAVLITRVDQVDPQKVVQIRKRIAAFISEDRIGEVRFVARHWLDSEGQQSALGQANKVLAFCGIGNPQGFQQTLQDLRCTLLELVAFADHHDYVQTDLDQINQIASDRNADAIVCTIKDLVKTRSLAPSNTPVFGLSIEAEFRSGQQMIVDLLHKSVTNFANSTAS